jgi:uroporphyrin-III C-methyltransferase
MKKGRVYLVGAGPGDPDFLTVKALRLLRTADVVFHDDLISPQILDLIPIGTYVENVGKRCGYPSTTQHQIHSLLINAAKEGLNVVRLKSGDPLVFGRAGEEMEALREAGIEFEVVPGITAAFGAAAKAQIPLTDRRLASKMVFLSNHHCADKTAPDWKDVISEDTTVVVYMPGADYDSLATRLCVAGLAPQTACLVVSRATSAQQRVHPTALAKLAEAPRLPAPVLLIIGAVAKNYSSADTRADILGGLSTQLPASDLGMAEVSVGIRANRDGMARTGATE